MVSAKAQMVKPEVSMSAGMSGQQQEAAPNPPGPPNPIGHIAVSTAATRTGEAETPKAIEIGGFDCGYGDFQALHSIGLSLP